MDPAQTPFNEAGKTSSQGYIDPALDVLSVSQDSTRREFLRSTAHAFCQALLHPDTNPPDKLIESFFSPTEPRITEHGPEWCRTRLPFLAHTFRGAAGDGSCEEYFRLLTATLKMHMDRKTFPGAEEFIVDEGAMVEGETRRGAVCVVSRPTTFESLRTGKKWVERFIYRFSGFDERGRFGHWEIWADPLSAWDAVGEE